MHHEQDTLRSSAARPPASPARGPSRRTLVKTAAHSVWTTPVVLAATAAPAMAASKILTVTFSSYWWKDWYWWSPPQYGVSPKVTVRNDATVATTDLRIALNFPPAYVGFDDTGGVRPRMTNWVGPPWSYAIPAATATGTIVALTREGSGSQLAGGASMTFVSSTPWWNPFSINWTNKPDAPITVTVTATGFAPVSTVLTKVGQPF